MNELKGRKDYPLAKKLAQAGFLPLFILLVNYLGYQLISQQIETNQLLQGISYLKPATDALAWLIALATSIWLSFRWLEVLFGYFQQRAQEAQARFWQALIPLLQNISKIIAAIMILDAYTSLLNLAYRYQNILDKTRNIAIILGITWLSVQIVQITEQLIKQRYAAELPNNFLARSVYTKTHVLKKLSLTIIGILSFAGLLMVFDTAREFGASILTSAGIFAAIITFAANQSLGGLFIGLQIALTQPIRIGDAVIVESEYGQIEEITLNYVVIKLWDLRRLVVPTRYFIEKPFQNWTRRSTELLCTVYLYADYSIPIEALRQEYARILKESSLWDGKVMTLQVSKSQENRLELRLLASVRNAPDSWDLGCYIREKLINYIQANCPDSLPKLRTDINLNQS